MLGFGARSTTRSTRVSFPRTAVSRVTRVAAVSSSSFFRDAGRGARAGARAGAAPPAARFTGRAPPTARGRAAAAARPVGLRPDGCLGAFAISVSSSALPDRFEHAPHLDDEIVGQARFGDERIAPRLPRAFRRTGQRV